MQLVERDLAPARPALDLDDGVERDERHAEIRRVRGDAVLAPAEHGMQPVLAAARVAARAGLALVAGAGGVVEIGAARPLQQIAADGRGIAQLRRRAGQQRFGDGREGAREVRVMREIGVAHQRADAHAAVGQLLDPIEARQAA